MRRLDNKIALVTGASRGIGRAIARRLGEDGALIAVHYGRRRDAAEETVRTINATGGNAFSVRAELDTREGVQELYQSLDAALTERTGSTSFDVLVNNAGISAQATIEQTDEALLDRLLAVNVKAPFFVIQQALPRLRDGGRIVNISSGVTRIAFPETTAYSVTKGAINTLTLTLAKQLGRRGITTNALLPGITDTDMNAGWLHTPEGRAFAEASSAIGRVGTSDDIAEVAAFLASDASRWITGQCIDVTGGAHL